MSYDNRQASCGAYCPDQQNAVIRLQGDQFSQWYSRSFDFPGKWMSDIENRLENYHTFWSTRVVSAQNKMIFLEIKIFPWIYSKALTGLQLQLNIGKYKIVAVWRWNGRQQVRLRLSLGKRKQSDNGDGTRPGKRNCPSQLSWLWYRRCRLLWQILYHVNTRRYLYGSTAQS